MCKAPRNNFGNHHSSPETPGLQKDPRHHARNGSYVYVACEVTNSYANGQPIRSLAGHNSFRRHGISHLLRALPRIVAKKCKPTKATWELLRRTPVQACVQPSLVQNTAFRSPLNDLKVTVNRWLKQSAHLLVFSLQNATNLDSADTRFSGPGTIQ